jgi:putative ABC transport system permease protein
VSQQTREIAIRIALGGERRHVFGMVMRLGLRLVTVGLAIGVGASLLTNRLLITQLWNTSPHDPVTFAGAVVLVLAVGGLACWVPARRALRVEPTFALRHE